MCEDCWDNDGDYDFPLTLERRYPKNKVTPDTTPAQYLEGWDVARGLYDLVDKSSINATDSPVSPVVGYYTTFRGSKDRQYSQPMFTLKPAGDECYWCENQPNDPSHPVEPFYMKIGCQCGNIAYMRDCPEHPEPSADSRWVRLQQAGDSRCTNCDIRLEPHSENHSTDWAYYCSKNCQVAWKKAYDERMAKLRAKYED